MNEELRPEYALRWGQERACERKYENARFSTELMGKGAIHLLTDSSVADVFLLISAHRRALSTMAGPLCNR